MNPAAPEIKSCKDPPISLKKLGLTPFSAQLLAQLSYSTVDASAIPRRNRSLPCFARRLRLWILDALWKSGSQDPRREAGSWLFPPTPWKTGLGFRVGGDVPVESHSAAPFARHRSRVRVLGLLRFRSGDTEPFCHRRGASISAQELLVRKHLFLSGSRVRSV